MKTNHKCVTIELSIGKKDKIMTSKAELTGEDLKPKLNFSSVIFSRPIKLSQEKKEQIAAILFKKGDEAEVKDHSTEKTADEEKLIIRLFRQLLSE